uniref:G-patch domain-containing protein n=1 Tax=Fagus sylvatica TaxID=28930 RepID=A0A2N9F574_FAGSY
MAEEASKLRGLEAPACQRQPRLYQLQEGQPSTFPRPSRTEPRQFQPLPIPVPQLYTLLVKKKMITPVGQRTRIGPQPKDYNKDLTCEYHQGEVGHTVENCRVLRHRIQDLLDQGVLKFRIEGVINTIGVEKSDEVDITSTKIPWEPLFHELKKRGLLTVPRAPKRVNRSRHMPVSSRGSRPQPTSCEEFKKEVASLITRGLIRRRRRTARGDCMTIDQLRLSPYERTNFQARMERIKEDFEEFCEKKKEELGKLTPATPPEMSKPDPVVIQYATKEKVMLQTASVSTVQSSEKVPSVVIQVPQPFPYHDNKRDITGPSFENMVTSILVTNQLTFSDDELPPEGRGHVKALYISVKTNDRIVSRVLIDNGSALNRGIRRDRLASRGWPASLQHQFPEPISIYNDGEIPYIDGCASEEASFHSFEFVTVIHRVAAVEPRLSRAGIMVAREFVKAGFQPGQGLGCANQGRTAIVTLEGNKDRYGLGYTPTRKDRQMAYEARRQRAAAKLRGERWPEKKMVIPHIRTTFPASAMFQVDEGDVDELALLFAEDLDVNVIITEGDSMTLPVRSDQYEEVDLENLLDEEDLKGYCIEEGTFDEDLGEEADLPNLLPHLMISRGLETLEFEVFREHEDPESHLQRYRKKMARYTDNEILMISMFHESLPECAVTWFYQLRNIACWEDLAKAFLDRYRHNIKTPPPSNITTTTAEEEYAGPMVEGLSIHTITEEEDSTTPPTRHCQQGEEAKMWTCVPLLQRVSSSNE